MSDVASKLDKEYIIFCDESDKKGKYYSNFYGGVLVGSSNWDSVVQRLSKVALDNNITSEVKWSKVGAYELEGYQKLMEAFFTEMDAGVLRMRVMFRQNAYMPSHLTDEHRKNEYFILYYQFLKHGFGFAHMPEHAPAGVDLRLYLDKLPNQNKESKEQFRGHIAALTSTRRLKNKGLRIAPENITDVDSKSHLLLQCMDVVLGSIAFRLNDKHKEKPAGSHQRGKRTIAKEKLYHSIRQQIIRVSKKGNFNIGVSTAPSKYPEGIWSDKYLHWNFKPKSSSYDPARTKNKKDPT